MEPRLNVILHRRDPNAPHEEYDDNRRERSRSRDDGQGPPRVGSTESQATTEEAVEEAASGAEGHGHPSHEHQSTPQKRDRANLQQRWRTLDRRLNRPRERSDRSSEGSSPPRPLSDLGDLVRRMSELDRRLQQPPPGQGTSSSSRAAGGLSNEERTRRNQEQADPMNAWHDSQEADVWPDSPGEREVDEALAAEREIEEALAAEDEEEPSQPEPDYIQNIIEDEWRDMEESLNELTQRGVLTADAAERLVHTATLVYRGGNVHRLLLTKLTWRTPRALHEWTLWFVVLKDQEDSRRGTLQEVQEGTSRESWKTTLKLENIGRNQPQRLRMQLRRKPRKRWLKVEVEEETPREGVPNEEQQNIARRACINFAEYRMFQAKAQRSRRRYVEPGED